MRFKMKIEELNLKCDVRCLQMFGQQSNNSIKGDCSEMPGRVRGPTPLNYIPNCRIVFFFLHVAISREPSCEIRLHFEIRLLLRCRASGTYCSPLDDRPLGSAAPVLLLALRPGMDFLSLSAKYPLIAPSPSFSALKTVMLPCLVRWP